MTPEQMEMICNHCLSLAGSILEDRKELFPFGLSINSEGQVVTHIADDGATEPDVIEALSTAAVTMQTEHPEGQVIATAIAAGVNINAGFGARFDGGIRLRLETPEYTQMVFALYHRKRKGLLGLRTRIEFSEQITFEQDPPELPGTKLH